MIQRLIFFARSSLFLLSFVTSVQGFDVKVLLQKISFEQCSKNPIDIISEQGFILSDHAHLALGHAYDGKLITVRCERGKVVLNGKGLKESSVYLYPQLSSVCLMHLQSRVSCWLESSRYELQHQSKSLFPLFDSVVQHDGPVSDAFYKEVSKYVFNIFDMFFDDLLSDIEQDSVVTQERLGAYIREFLQKRLRVVFTEQLSEKHLTSQYRAMLLQDKKKRYDFFDQELYTLLSKLLPEFVQALPRKLLQQIIGEPVGMFTFDSNPYLGSFIIYQEKNNICIINCLDIEDYLQSVVRYEGWPGWPVEANKVIAVACRTYLVYQVLKAQQTSKPYHIENGVKHQRYKGYHFCKVIKQALEETKDMVVAFDGKPACAMFDCCCGGIIPGHIDDPCYQSISYLARTYPCTFCKGYKKVYDWSVDFSADDMVKRLQKDFPKIDKISDVHVMKKDKAGLVKKISIMAGKRKIIITDKKMKSLFPELKSYCFNITRYHKRYMIQGIGLGHHRGLCQWGSFHLIKHEHWNFKEVLQFYYPGTTLIKLTYDR
ncbi:SpoIID/LytB domain-containing protein [Candidatus Babeliales bacterium]|nr:SpoIID/LytB domain-containing protein [Candidatus Babeliales bacterium]